MIFLKLLGTLIRVIRDGATPNQIAGGLVLGVGIGLTPGWPLQVWLLLCVMFLLNVNMGIGIACAFASAAVAWVLDSVLHGLGMAMLGIGSLEGVYTSMYNSEFWMLSRFNNSVVMGALVLWLISTLPLFFLGRVGVTAYRTKLEPWVMKLRVVRMIQGSKFYGWYERISQLRVW